MVRENRWRNVSNFAQGERSGLKEKEPEYDGQQEVYIGRSPIAPRGQVRQDARGVNVVGIRETGEF